MCPWEAPNLLIFSQNVPPFLYYTHIPAIILSLLVGIYLFSKQDNKTTGIFLLIAIFFSIWSFIDIILWATNNPHYVYLLWSFQILLEPLLYVLLVLFVNLFTKPRYYKIFNIVFLLLLVPIAIGMGSDAVIIGIDLNDCTALEGYIGSFYTYAIEIFAILYVTIQFLNNLFKKKKNNFNLFLLFGTLLFMILFTAGNILGSHFQLWEVAQVGLLGMPLFMGIIIYSFSRFNYLNIKFSSVHLLVFTLWGLMGSLLTIRDLRIMYIVITFTLIMLIGFGIKLIKSYNREVELKIRNQTLAKSLEESNAKLEESNALKSKFLSIASHQFRSPVTALKGYAELILDGSYGEITPKLQEPLERIFTSSNNLALIVNDFLNLSRIESGRMEYTFGMHDVREIAQSAVAEQMPIVHQRGNIHLRFSNDGQENYNAVLDPGMIKQVLTNIIDNAIKYTPEGEIHVRIEKDETKNVIRFSTTDAGVGIPPESIDKLFSQFSRASNANTINVMGTGLGLYIAKEIIKAHNGSIWAESMGEGKGSTFVVELPIENKE